MSKYTAKQIAESDDLFDKQIHKVVSSGQLFFVDDEYAGTVKLTNLDNGESNISFPSCDDGLIINPADKHIK